MEEKPPEKKPNGTGALAPTDSANLMGADRERLSAERDRDTNRRQERVHAIVAALFRKLRQTIEG